MPKSSRKLMGSALMAILGLLTLSNAAQALKESTPPEVSILPIIIDEGDGGFKPGDDEWVQPGRWIPRSLYFSFDTQTKAIQTFTDSTLIPAALGLPKASNGLYYGVDSFGGLEGYGSIFSLNPENNTKKELVNFVPSSDDTGFLFGSFPSSLTLGNNDVFYGTTPYGGKNNSGSIFMFNPNGNTLERVADFESASDGYGSAYSVLPSVLTLANNGLLYGITAHGGEHNAGYLFSFPSQKEATAPSQKNVTIVANFKPIIDANGYEYLPYPSSLTLGNDGNLYGTTSGQGEGNLATIFSFAFDSKDSTTGLLSTVANFDPLADENNFGFLSFPSNLTRGNGDLLYGTVYEHDPSIYYTIRLDNLGNNPTAVPEPLTLLGTVAAINFGMFFKKRGKKAAKKS